MMHGSHENLNLPVHPRQRQRLQRANQKQKIAKEREKQYNAQRNSSNTSDDETWEDAMDEDSITKSEQTKLWSAQVWDCALSGNIQSMLILAARGYSCDIPHPRSGITPLWAAAENGNSDMVRFLLETMSVNVNARANDGSTALFAAAQNGHADVMVILLTDWGYGAADTNLTRATDGATPLYVSAQRAHLPCIKLLLANGADPNKRRKGGYTPLWTACDRGHQSVVDILLSQLECDLSLASEAGVKPSTAAKRNGHRALSRFIELMAKRQTSAQVPKDNQVATRVVSEHMPENETNVSSSQGEQVETAIMHDVEVKEEGQDKMHEERDERDEVEEVRAETKVPQTKVNPASEDNSSIALNYASRRTGPGEQSSDTSLFVYSKEGRRGWSWEAYIRQSALHTHNLTKCVRSNCDQDVKFECAWRKRTTELSDFTGFSRPQILPGLFDQIDKLHLLVESRSPPDMNNIIETKHCTMKPLYVNHCIFTEGRGIETHRVHTLEFRIGHMRPKRAKECNWRRYRDPSLVSPDDVVILLGLPLHFPSDSRVRIHCMQGHARLPPHLFANHLKNDKARCSVMEGSTTKPVFRPGDTIQFAWMDAHCWDNGGLTLSSFLSSLLEKIEESDGLFGGLLPPLAKMPVMNTAHADALLRKNEAAAKSAEDERLARLSAPLTKQNKRARILTVLGMLGQIAFLAALLYLRKHGY